MADVAEPELPGDDRSPCDAASAAAISPTVCGSPLPTLQARRPPSGRLYTPSGAA